MSNLFLSLLLLISFSSIRGKDHFSAAHSLGITATHPIYSTTYHDWRLAGELEVGERVLTFKGEATVSSTEKRAGSETVYNLEVKDLHNFLVGDEGVVVHNICWKEIDDFFQKSLTDKRKMINDAYGAWYPQIFVRRSFLEGIMRKTKFKDWNHTYDLAKNYKGIDFYKKVNGKSIVSSMKTTKLDDVQSWIAQNTEHLTELINGKNLGKFDSGSNSIPADIVQLNLFTKKGLSAAERKVCQDAIEAHSGGKIKAIVEVIEKSL